MHQAHHPLAMQPRHDMMAARTGNNIPSSLQPAHSPRGERADWQGQGGIVDLGSCTYARTYLLRRAASEVG